MLSIVIISVLLFINTALFFLLKKVNPSSYRKRKSDVFKGIGSLLIALIFFCGYMYFFKEHSLLFECHKETMTCTYSRSTEFNKTLRPVKTFDISSIEQADMYRFRRGKSRRYGVLLDMKKGPSVEVPFDFSYEHEAQAEADEFNSFLFSSKKNYAYVKYLSDISSAKNTSIVITVLTLLYFLFYILGGFREKTFDADEDYDYEDNEIEPPSLSSDEQNDDEFLKEVEAYLKETDKQPDAFKQKSDGSKDDLIRRTRNI